MDHEIKQELNNIKKMLEALAGQCLAYEVLFKSLNTVEVDRTKLDQMLKSCVTPFGTSVKSIADKLIKEVVK